MPTNILMPALSPTMTEGKLAKWHVTEGDAVEAGDVIAEIETDKATMEVEAADEGKVGKIIVAEGTDAVAVNEPIAVLLDEGEDESALEDFDVKGAADNKAQKEEKKENDKADQKQNASAPQGSQEKTGSKDSDKGGERIFASPLAKRLAAQQGIDLSAIKGSGPHGRIVKADVDKTKGQPVAGAQEKAPTDKAVPPSPAPKAAPVAAGPDAKKLADAYGMAYKEIPNNNIRKVVATRLLESKQTVPHFYLTIECRIDELLKTRKEINEKAGGDYKLSVNDFIIKACANALKTYPAANTAWTDEAILQFKHADISVAVATPNGLMTPIVKEAESKGLRRISEEVKDLAVRARDGKLKPEEFQGGTFTVSNLGMYGIKEFGAIINPPQSCILAVGAGEQKPYVDNGEVKVGTFMTCTLSVDHRSVDGAVGAEYLQVFKRFIENPIEMLVG